ncbi:hypothetical protein D8S78_11645 [Natrialba swarupiae]|nr:hypothetical protein [Natrialba swarupiae]
MGDEVFVYLMLTDSADHSMEKTPSSSDQLLMSVTPDTEIRENQSVDVVLDRSKVHLFETETGTALAHGITDRSERESGPATGEADS